MQNRVGFARNKRLFETCFKYRHVEMVRLKLIYHKICHLSTKNTEASVKGCFRILFFLFCFFVFLFVSILADFSLFSFSCLYSCRAVVFRAAKNFLLREGCFLKVSLLPKPACSPSFHIPFLRARIFLYYPFIYPYIFPFPKNKVLFEKGPGKTFSAKEKVFPGK